MLQVAVSVVVKTDLRESVIERARARWGARWQDAIERAWPGWWTEKTEHGIIAHTWYSDMTDREFAALLHMVSEIREARLRREGISEGYW